MHLDAKDAVVGQAVLTYSVTIVEKLIWVVVQTQALNGMTMKIFLWSPTSIQLLQSLAQERAARAHG